ncbi:Serine/threonine-protein kinase mph1 [Hordeum vulgare]|nr:Serine/threonine-protein kinase mph1 [Hordeum vulgare]
MATPMALVDDTYCAQFMEDVIYKGGHVPAYDPDETQSHDGRAQFVADEEADEHADYDHGDSWHGDDDIYCEGDGDEDEVKDIDISGEPLFIDELTQRVEAQKKKKSIRTGSYGQDEDKLICNSWMEISQDPRTGAKRGKKTTKFTEGGDGEALKRPRGKTNSKVDDIRDAASMALHETLHGMMSQKDMRDEKKRQSKDEQMKQYLELQRKKLEMEEAAKKRKIDLEEAARQRQLDIEAANVEARKRQLDIEATNAATKAKEVALAIMSVDLTKMSEKTRIWFEARQKEMFDADDLN